MIKQTVVLLNGKVEENMDLTHIYLAVANSNSCRNISIFYLINFIFAAETIQLRKLFKGVNYMRKYGKQF
jgi:hypothetical protein